MSPAVWSSVRRPLCAGGGVGAPGVRRQREQVCRRVGHDGSPVSSGTIWSARLSSICNGLGPGELLGRDMEAVDVALDGVEQPGGRIAELSQQGGG